ncbi:uncharacterized protein ccdc14 isoform X2 [Salarias fasciatus]|uniref:uncharacterized protein ccdc14 isoform X2 n=1 Tax=Salarias fasciatus TaxID=181472 RepID=UPI0011770154|nr:coiled-coil domain-containing protein 14 isoform X2 [Salarias fasciatus]
MKGKVKRKVLTSGRLTGAVGANKGSVNPRVVHPEPAYSLYSTDSENQIYFPLNVLVLPLCLNLFFMSCCSACVLEDAGSSLVLSSLVVVNSCQVSTLHQGLDRCAALLSNLLQAEGAGKAPVPNRTVKAEGKPAAPPTSRVKKTLKKLPTHTGQRGATSNTRARSHSVPAAGRKLQPPHRAPPPPHRVPPTSHSSPPPHTSVLLAVHQSSSDHRCSPEALPTPQLHQEEEDDLVPVRDSSSVTSKDSGTIRDDVTTRNGVLRNDRTETLQDLLSELKALITGHGSVAEMLLSRLELIVSPSLQSSDTTGLLALQSENAQLHRRLRTLNQQLQQREKAQRPHSLCDPEGPGPQEDDLAELRRALADAQSRLQDREEENARLQADLEEAWRRLQDGEQQRSRMEEEIRNLNRLLQIGCSSPGPAVINTIHSRQDPSAPLTDRIAHYLESLSLSEPGTTAEPFPRPDASSRTLTTRPNPPCSSSEPEPRGPPDSGSTWSESSFNTRDEAAFRDGLAALDASIASLQRSIQLDLRR